MPYTLNWDTAANLHIDTDFFVSTIIHELVHAASARQYTSNLDGPNIGNLVWLNMNLPQPVGEVDPQMGLAPNQLAVLNRQIETIDANWTDLYNTVDEDNRSDLLGEHFGHIKSRIEYALTTAFVHNDTVLGDLMYYMQAKGLAHTATYRFAQRMLKEANDRRTQGFWATPNSEVRRVDSRAWWFQFWKW